ncbi:methyl-accepting chemotaxis protein [Ferruginivarius sediminum]|nr:methyl-accepting chemotaxis protein [Ferruginivarius sediminum]
MPKLRLTIRASLLSISAVLCVAVVVLAGLQTLDAWNAMTKAQEIGESDTTSTLLLESAADWAVERGTTVAALASREPIDSARRARIYKQRQAADEKFAAALDRIAERGAFRGRDNLVADAKAAHADLQETRAKLDRELAKSKAARSYALDKEWVPVVTKTIHTSQRLRRAAAYVPETVLSRQMLLRDFKDAIWVMSEYAGRERAVIGAAITAEEQLDTEKIGTLSRFRGRAEQAWGQVESYLDKDGVSPRIRGAVDKVEQSFFGTFEDARQEVYEAGIAGEPYPIDTEEWVGRATQGIDNLLALADAASGVSQEIAEVTAGEARNAVIANAIVLLIGIALAVLAVWVVLGRVVRPIRGITDGMRALADGNLEVELPNADRGDEVAEMSQAVEVFRQNALEVRRLEEEQKEQAKRAEEEKRRAMHELADSFESSVKGIVDHVASAATEMESTAGSMSTIAEQSQRQAAAVASAAEQASGNVQTVASASEELGTSIGEIGRQAGNSTKVAKGAVEKADATTRQVENLVSAAGEIGKVVTLIQDIAEQTNLLALNATIEAARAGDAGKGFAVVANEVKSLANQTAKATEEISSQISTIQDATGEAASSIKAISQTIHEIDESSSSIAGAVEQQNAATGEISRNAQEAATGTNDVSQNAEGLNAASQETGTAATQVLNASRDLAEQSQNLGKEVANFLQRIRAA